MSIPSTLPPSTASSKPQIIEETPSEVATTSNAAKISNPKYRVGLHGTLDIGSQGYLAAFLGPLIPLAGVKLGTVIDGKHYGTKLGGVFKAGLWNATFVEGGIYGRFLAHKKDPRYSLVLNGGIAGGKGLKIFLDGQPYLKPDLGLGFEWRRFKHQTSTLSLAVIASGVFYIPLDGARPGGLANVHMEIGFDFYTKRTK